MGVGCESMTDMANSTDVSRERQVLSLIDLTLLGDDDQVADVEALCDNATTPFGDVAAVCVWPQFVTTAIDRLGDAGIEIAAVANFPSGDNDPERAVRDAREIAGAGGTEVDVVFPWRSLAAGETGVGSALVSQVRAALPDSVLLKVILETGELHEPDLIEAAALEAIEGGANFLKTSTGKTEHSASPAAARQLFELASAADHLVGVKISGGVRTVEQAITYIDIADEILGSQHVSPSTMRIGASSLLAAVLDSLSGTAK